MRKEPVAKIAGSLALTVGKEGVFAPPPLPVGGVERIEVDVSPVTVERTPARRRAETEDPLACISEPAEDVAETAGRPVLVDDKMR
jgi:hypothetical protein